MKDSHVTRFTIKIATEGHCDIINLAKDLAPKLKTCTGDGVLHLFVVGSTAALTTIEFENGLVTHDMRQMFQRLIPEDIPYQHEATWHDDNGHAHLRASMIGPSLSLPFHKGELLVGEYQQVVLIDFDTRPRRRKIIATVLYA